MHFKKWLMWNKKNQSAPFDLSRKVWVWVSCWALPQIEILSGKLVRMNWSGLCRDCCLWFAGVKISLMENPWLLSKTASSGSSKWHSGTLLRNYSLASWSLLGTNPNTSESAFCCPCWCFAVDYDPSLKSVLILVFFCGTGVWTQGLILSRCLGIFFSWLCRYW
jgi:hypothetical protein